jgi:hypothetical protein
MNLEKSLGKVLNYYCRVSNPSQQWLGKLSLISRPTLWSIGGPKGCLFKQSAGSGQLALQWIQQLTIFFVVSFFTKGANLKSSIYPYIIIIIIIMIMSKHGIYN